MDPRNPAYVPNIFNSKDSTKEKIGEKIIDRYKRHKRRSESSSQNNSICSVDDIGLDCSLSQESPTTSVQIMANNAQKDKWTQTPDFHVDECNFKFSSSFEYIDGMSNVSTEAIIPHKITLGYINPKIDRATGISNNYDDLKGFHGYDERITEDQLKKITGVSKKVFELFLGILDVSSNVQVKKENRLLIFLIKMKQGIPFHAISVYFCINPSTVSRIFEEVLLQLSSATKNYIFWPDKEIIQDTMPIAFKIHYSDCRCIIDCTEFKIEQPSTVEMRVYTYSQYKSAYTFKILIAISPNGSIIFISKCYGGKTSDTFITTDCGLVNLLQPGDIVLADKGFPGIKTSVEDKNAIVVIPPFRHDGHLTEEELLETNSIASVRIHVERAIQRVKIYNILHKINTSLFPYVDNIVHMCCIMANLQAPIINN